jgi:hypothetical protein|nr:MAG TPA: Loader and inhibitor of phage G40P [Caudoviricetes sp.]DAT04998.1 MAG TPA: Loader and inhibitor of phage G40P [Caudoviricetes sp.]
MDRKEFKCYIDQIENFYGQKLNEVERDIWYENLKFMSVERFNYILSDIYRTNKFMPRLADILQVHKQIPYTAKKEEREIKSSCKKCNGAGYVFYTKEINNKKYKYSAVCDCGRCERYDGTKCADPKNKSKYYIPTIAETGLNIQENKPTNDEIVRSMRMLQNSPIISENIKDIIRENFRRRVKA